MGSLYLGVLLFIPAATLIFAVFYVSGDRGNERVKEMLNKGEKVKCA